MAFWRRGKFAGDKGAGQGRPEGAAQVVGERGK